MKRTSSRPIILPLPTLARLACEARPRILPFPTCAGGNTPKASAECDLPSDADLAAVRDRLFRMIVANQSDHSHGNRAS